MLQLAFPGLVIGFGIVVGVNWIFFKWKWSCEIAFTLAMVFCAYCIALIVVGPGDTFGLVGWLRRYPSAIESVAKFFGVK